MKRIFVLLQLILMIFFCCGCDFDSYLQGEIPIEEAPTYINVIVSGVDDGILHCKYVCEWKNSYAYYDEGIIYYFENADSEPYQIDTSTITYMAMNERYIFYARWTGLYVIDKLTMEKKMVEELRTKTVSGINIYDNEVILYVADDSGITYYEMDGYNIAGETTLKSTDVFLSSNNHCANNYGDESTYIYTDNEIFNIHSEAYYIVGEDEERIQFDDVDSGAIAGSTEHISEYEDKLYILLQGSKAADNLNVAYNLKEWDQIICFDTCTRLSESIYKASGPEEQIVNFSVENDELFLLIDGILYKTNLYGENKIELANLSGISKNLSFDYVNDTLFVYDGEKMLGQYK